MAYADKSTDMRRCCISINGHVEWEGVDIDDIILLKRRTGIGEFESIINSGIEDIERTIEEFNTNWQNEKNETVMKLLYQDGEDCDWDVKTSFVVSLEGDKQ